MQSIVHDSAAPGGLRRTDQPDPVPAPDQLVLTVSAASLNYLDVAYAEDLHGLGGVPGEDAAGTVVTAAVDGSGPPVGTAVVSFAMGGALATRRAVRTADVAAIPEGVSFEAAAALPAAGVTALRAVRRLGPLLGRRVIVTGASGGVGRYAVQLAALAGADVTAVSSRREGLRELGADRVVDDLSALKGEPFDGVVDQVGGPMLAEAFALLGEGGLALSVGQASGQATEIDFELERRRGGRRTVEVFTVTTGYAGFSEDMAVMLGLVAAGRLDPQVGWSGDWSQVTQAAAALRDRHVTGKAVLTVHDR